MFYLGRGVSEQFKKSCTKLLLVFRVVEDCIRDLGNFVSLQIFQIWFQLFQSISDQRAYKIYIEYEFTVMNIWAR